MERNFETVMIEQCAPVLAGLKPAGLFRYETRTAPTWLPGCAAGMTSWGEGAEGPGPQGLCSNPPVSHLCLPREPPASGAGR